MVIWRDLRGRVCCVRKEGGREGGRGRSREGGRDREGEEEGGRKKREREGRQVI